MLFLFCSKTGSEGNLPRIDPSIINGGRAMLSVSSVSSRRFTRGFFSILNKDDRPLIRINCWNSIILKNLIISKYTIYIQIYNIYGLDC